MKDKNRLSNFTQFNLGSFTSHEFICASYQIDTSASEAVKSYTFRSLDKINITALHKRVTELDWSPIYNTADIDEMVEIVTTKIVQLLDEFAPEQTKTVTRRPDDPSWMTDELRSLIDLRNFHHAASKSKMSSDRSSHKALSKRYGKDVNRLKNRLQFKANKRHLFGDISAKKLWQNFRKLGIVNEKSSSSPNFNVEEINLHLSKIFTPRRNEAIQDLLTNLPISDDISGLQFSVTTGAEVESVIFSIVSNACGDDGITIKFIKMLTPLIVPFVTHVINCCITQSYFPCAWKAANVFTIPKVQQPKGLDDYRPISILPCLSKILEKILHSQLMDHLLSNSLLDNFQSGFRPFHSTNTALLKIHHDIYREIQNGRGTILVLLDFKKAFDLVPHHILIDKLINKFKLSRFAAKMLLSYLSDRTQKVNINNLQSKSVPVTSGVPQGGILSALLFSLFINDLPSFIRSKFSFAKVHLYADDTQIYIHFDPTFGCDVELHLMNEILAHTQRWCSLNEVVLNASKTKALIISDKTTDRTTELNVNGEQIEICKEARNLGYIMNSSFKSDSHVSKVANSIKFTVAMLRQSQNITPFSARVKLVKALIIPKILYCSNIYGKMSSTSASELKVAFNSAIRYIHKKVITHSEKDSTSKEVLQFLSTTNVNTFIMAHMCIFLHRLQRTAQPKYLHSILLKRRRLNTLDPPEFTNSLARKDFFFIGPWEWNRLPANVRSEISADKFRQKCLSFYASVHEWNKLLV